MWLLLCYCHNVCVCVCVSYAACAARKIENPTVWTFTDVISIKNSVGIKAKHLMDEQRRKKIQSQPYRRNGFWQRLTFLYSCFGFRMTEWISIRMDWNSEWFWRGNRKSQNAMDAMPSRQNSLKIFIYLTYSVIIQMYGCNHVPCYTIIQQQRARIN